MIIVQIIVVIIITDFNTLCISLNNVGYDNNILDVGNLAVENTVVAFCDPLTLSTFDLHVLIRNLI